jgi:hypothetical protein
VWVFPRGLEVEGQKVLVLLNGLGGLEDRKSKAPCGPAGFGSCFGSLGEGG